LFSRTLRWQLPSVTDSRQSRQSSPTPVPARYRHLVPSTASPKQRLRPVHPRRSCSTHLFRRSLLSIWHVLHSQINEPLVLFTHRVVRPLLHSALVQVHRKGPHRRTIKIPTATQGISGTALVGTVCSRSALPSLLDVAPFPS
jgi:hypothetical protein